MKNVFLLPVKDKKVGSSVMTTKHICLAYKPDIHRLMFKKKYVPSSLTISKAI